MKEWFVKIVEIILAILDMISGKPKIDDSNESTEEENNVGEQHEQIENSPSGVEETEDGGLNFDNIRETK